VGENEYINLKAVSGFRSGPEGGRSLPPVLARAAVIGEGIEFLVGGAAKVEPLAWERRVSFFSIRVYRGIPHLGRSPGTSNYSSPG
jgi:hypothetical protein